MADYSVAPETPEPETKGPKVRANGLTAAEEKKLLAEARSRMKRAMEQDQADRDRAREELRFVWNAENCQWDTEAKTARKNRPCLTENRNPAFIRQATNQIRRSRPQIRVLPVDDQGDPQTAQVLEGLIRNIEANSRADLSYDQATDSAGYCGRGYWKVTTEYQGDGFEQDIVIDPVPDPFSIVDDPDAMMPDKSDRKFAFEVEHIPRDEYESEYGVKPKSFAEASDALGDDAQYWGDQNCVVVANYWRVVTEKSPIYRMSDGKVVPNPKEYLDGLKRQAAVAARFNPMAAQFPPILPQVLDQRDLVKRRVEWYCVSGDRAHEKGEWKGQYIPLIYTTCEQMRVDGKWQTKGMTFDAQDLTKANNYLLSAQIENIALTPKVPFIGPVGSFSTDKGKWNKVNVESYAYVEYDVQDADGKPLPPPQRAQGVTGQPEIASVRQGVIDGQRAVVGLMGASLGDRGPETAWRAIQARQSEGDTAVFHVMDNLVRAVRYCGMVLVDLIPHIYDTARVVRIINPDGEPQMQAINSMFFEDQPDGSKKERKVTFASGKYDVSVTAGPAFETQRQQDSELTVQLLDKIPAIGTVAPDLVAKQLMSTGNGEKIAQRLAKTVPPEIMGNGPSPAEQKLQQQIQEMQGQMQQTTQAKDFAESELMRQKSVLEREQVKAQSDVAKLQAQVEKAGIDREKALLEVRKKELELMREAMPEPMRPMVGPEGQWQSPEMPEEPEPEEQEPSAAEILAPALAHMGEQIGAGLRAVAETSHENASAIAQLAAAHSAPKPKGKKRATLPDGRVVTLEDL